MRSANFPTVVEPRIQARIIGFDPSRVDSTQDYLSFKEGGRVKGGLRQAAEGVRSAGRHGDDVLVHINRNEFEAMRRAYGDPLINPETGIPEWGFFDSLKKIIKKVAPILSVASIFIPGLSPIAALGKGIGAVTGLGATASNVLGGAALGGITDGGRGALTGGLGTYLSMPTKGGGSPLQAFGQKIMPNANESTQLMLGRGLTGAGMSAVNDEDPLQGALSAVMMGDLSDRFRGSDFVQEGLRDKPMLQQAALGAARGAEVGGLTGANPALAAGVGAFSGAAQSTLEKIAPGKFGMASTTYPEAGLAATLQASPDLHAILAGLKGYSTKADALANLEQMIGQNPDQRPIYDALQSFTGCDASGDFGSCIAQNWDQLTQSIGQNAPKRMAEGGPVELLSMLAGGQMGDAPLEGEFISGRDEGYVSGPGDGQDDLVDAMLADGEYVIPADVVSALGSGSTSAGAQSLDEMVQSIRGHYRSTPPQALPPKSRSPLEHLSAGG